MKHYIRTKGGIYRLEDLLPIEISANIQIDYEKWLPNSKIADTIEELCDEFYIDYGEKRFPYSTYRQHERYAGWGDLIRYLRTIHFTGYDGVYGYIWSVNELKLVAKMNEKGELELL